MMIA